MQKEVDIIIPAYKAHDTIFKTLCSIATQTVADKIMVTIVNDCCPEGDYQKVIRQFKGRLDIRELKLSKNGGPGAARRHGLENATCPYIMFVDADDSLYGGVAVEQLLCTISNPDNNADVVFSDFVQRGDTMSFAFHSRDIVWVFGKIYNRQFLIDNDITFTDLRANEDTCFNRKVYLVHKKMNKEIYFLDAVTYLWQNHKNSITNINQYQYTYDQSICGWVDGLIEYFNWAHAHNISQNLINDDVMIFMAELYTYYCGLGAIPYEVYENPDTVQILQEQNFEYVKKFYHLAWLPNKIDYHNQEFVKAYTEVVYNQIVTNMNPNIYMAQPNIVQFMDMLEHSPYNENDIIQIRKKLPEDMKQNNIECGVCDKDYYKEK